MIIREAAWRQASRGNGIGARSEGSTSTKPIPSSSQHFVAQNKSPLVYVIASTSLLCGQHLPPPSAKSPPVSRTLHLSHQSLQHPYNTPYYTTLEHASHGIQQAQTSSAHTLQQPSFSSSTLPQRTPTSPLPPTTYHTHQQSLQSTLFPNTYYTHKKTSFTTTTTSASSIKSQHTGAWGHTYTHKYTEYHYRLSRARPVAINSKDTRSRYTFSGFFRMGICLHSGRSGAVGGEAYGVFDLHFRSGLVWFDFGMVRVALHGMAC